MHAIIAELRPSTLCARVSPRCDFPVIHPRLIRYKMLDDTRTPHQVA